MSEVENVLVDRLTNVFGAPERVENVEGFISELKRITAGFSRAALDQAASVLIADGGKSWPAPKTIVQACVDAQEAIDIRTGKPREKHPCDAAADNAEKWAREFCKTTEIGQRAFAEGWGRNLYLWAKSYAHENFKRDTPPNPSRRPQPSDIEYWVRYCRAPPSWLELERVTCLRTPFSAETNSHLNRRIAGIGRPIPVPAFKQMPVEDDAA